LAVATLVYREKTLPEWIDAVSMAATTTAQVMIILAAAGVLSWYLTSQGLAVAIADGILSFSQSPLHLFMLINVTVLIVGMFLDAASIMVILGPLLYQVGVKVGIDPI